MSEATFRHKRIGATLDRGPAGTLVSLSLNNQLIAMLSEPEARSLGVFLAGSLAKEEREITQETTAIHEERINGVMRIRVDKDDGMTSVAVRGEGGLTLFGNEARALCDVLTKYLPGETERSADKQSASMVQEGAMAAQIFPAGEAIVRVGVSSVALEPGELRALYAFLGAHYEQQRKASINV